MIRIALVLVLGTLAARFIPATTGSAEAKAKRLTATVGPGFTISMSVKSVKPGTYTITVKDRSSIHNFHLIGRGVDKAMTTWKVTLKKGTYRFICDPHRSFMKGVLKVG
jgi:plastocyanin